MFICSAFARMSTSDLIKKPIEQELKLFEKHFRESMKSAVPLLDTIMTYIVKRKGKQMRPMFVFLTSRLFNGTNESTYRAASLIELLHTATLVHDDVVDDSDERRGFFSINALWKNKIAVLVGDYLLSRGLLLAVKHKEFRLLEIVSDAVKEMSEGELLQIEKTRNLNLSEEVYYDIIRKKTASLIASCCATGAASSGASEEQIRQMWLFGEKVGIAFQLKDDLLDYGNDDIGKPVGIDLKEKKLTLPIIHTINNADQSTRKKIINTIKNHHNDKKRIADVIQYVNEHDGIAYARKAMHRHREEALAILEKVSPGADTAGLKMLVDYVIDRKN